MQVNLSTFLNFGRTLYFGGAHAPSAAPAMVSPPKPDTPDNRPAANLQQKKGLQATLLTGGGSAAQAGTLLGGGAGGLGASSKAQPYGFTGGNSNGGEA